ncbi:MAG: EAL domain-containing protein [Candidatus Omnitrophica bacterium]|nr:EAL domain-containing protein [Candidatus Omnitrophota bacterium]
MKEKKILLVDDDHDLCHVIFRLLNSRNYSVDVTHNGEDGLKQSFHHPDLILLDRTLPDIEGLDICRQIREDKRRSHIPIIIFSSMDKSTDKIKGLYIGADDYITKPYEPEELLARIEAVLRRQDFSEASKEDKGKYIMELMKIIENKSIVPFFQPIFSLEDFQPIGYEVLSRPPQDSLLSNPEFLFKIAIESGMYFDLEMLCWHKAFVEWKKNQSPEKLFLNCSPYLIENEKFTESILIKEDVPVENLVFEITERMAIVDYTVFLERIHKFRKLKIGIAVDDVGCGFASLDTVAEVRPDIIKIDMPLIQNIQRDSLKQGIVESVVFFCRKCGITTVAEGIEKEEELKTIISLGVDAGQGFLLARPSPEISPVCNV